MTENTTILLTTQSGALTPANGHAITDKEAQQNIDTGSLQYLPVQRKLSVGAANDPLEEEADAMADKVMRMPEPFIQRKCKECEEEENKVQRKESTGAATPAITPAVEQALQSTGQSMDKPTRSFMEERFGYDFSNVQIHNDLLAHQSATDINALAYTNNNHVVFGAGQYQPDTTGGKQLLAHELTHVVQQQSNSIQCKTSADAGIQNSNTLSDVVSTQNDTLQKDEIKEKQSERIASVPVAGPPDAPSANKPVTVDTVMRMPKKSFIQHKYTNPSQEGKLRRQIE